jgi:hypothetical protein
MRRTSFLAGLTLALCLPLVAFAQAIPEPDVGGLGAAFLSALSSKNWGLLLAAVVLAAVWGVRALGAKVWPAVATARGSAILAFAGGTAALLVAALGAGQPFSAGLLLGCISTALTASGLWSTGKAVVEKPKPVPSMTCTPEEIANRTCIP